MNVLYFALIKNFFIQKEAGVPKKIIKVEDIPGLSKFFDILQIGGFSFSWFCTIIFATYGNVTRLDNIWLDNVILHKFQPHFSDVICCECMHIIDES